MTDYDDEPIHAQSATAEVIDGLEQYGYRPAASEPDTREGPDPEAARTALTDIFDALVSTFEDTCLESDLQELLHGTVQLFHRAADRAQRGLDDNEDAQRRSQAVQDGSEIRSVELETLIAAGTVCVERRNTFEDLRDYAADLFEVHTGSAWRPRHGSRVNHRAMTATLIDSREFVSAKRRSETEVMMPAGIRIAFAGGLDFEDHRMIWDALDRAHGKHPDMVLLHGGSPRGAERIAALWAENRKVTQVVFKPDWTRHAKAAPFKRNDALLETLPAGLIVFPGSGITENLADKARAMGIPVWRFAGAH